MITPLVFLQNLEMGYVQVFLQGETDLFQP